MTGKRNKKHLYKALAYDQNRKMSVFFYDQEEVYEKIYSYKDDGHIVEASRIGSEQVLVREGLQTEGNFVLCEPETFVAIMRKELAKWRILRGKKKKTKEIRT